MKDFDVRRKNSGLGRQYVVVIYIFQTMSILVLRPIIDVIDQL